MAFTLSKFCISAVFSMAIAGTVAFADDPDWKDFPGALPTDLPQAEDLQACISSIFDKQDGKVFSVVEYGTYPGIGYRQRDYLYRLDGLGDGRWISGAIGEDGELTDAVTLVLQDGGGMDVVDVDAETGEETVLYNVQFSECTIADTFGRFKYVSHWTYEGSTGDERRVTRSGWSSDNHWVAQMAEENDQGMFALTFFGAGLVE